MFLLCFSRVQVAGILLVSICPAKFSVKISDRHVIDEQIIVMIRDLPGNDSGVDKRHSYDAKYEEYVSP